MENNKENNADNNASESIFDGEEFSIEGYDKNIRQARNTLFFLAALQLLLGIYFLFTSSESIGLISFAITTLVAIIFLVLGFWTKQKPYTAIVYALIIYILLWIADCVFDPTYIYRGIILKIIVIGYLAKSLKDAKETQQMKALMSK